jgi:putative transposase
VKYAFIHQQGKSHPIVQLCQVLGVSTSGYYDWMLRPEGNRAKSHRRFLTKIQCFHKASRGIYGSPRIHQDLLSSGEQAGVHRVARLMRQAGIQSRMAKKFVMTTNSRNTLAPAPDRLERQFYTHRKNQAWVSDTTFIATRQGWLYLAVVLDLFSRQVIG